MRRAPRWQASTPAPAHGNSSVNAALWWDGPHDGFFLSGQAQEGLIADLEAAKRACEGAARPAPARARCPRARLAARAPCRRLGAARA